MTDPTTGRLTDTDLDEIAARAAALYEYGAEACGPDVDQLADTDIPALLAEVRRLRAVPSPAAELANLRAMYDAVSAREHELIEERDKLVRWHGEDEAAHKEMRATIERLRTEKRELGELAARRESELIYYRYRKTAAKTPAGRADDDPRSIPVYTPGMAPGEEIAMLRRTLIAAEDGRVELRAECARLRDLLWKRDTDRAAVLREAADDLATAFGDPMAKHIGHLGAAHLRRRAREIESGQTTETRPETPLEKRLRYSERRNDELRAECKRRGKRVLEQSEAIRALKREVDEVQRQLGAEILRAGQAEAELRRMADEAQQSAAEEQPSGTRPCGHDDYHDAHPWHDLPDVWCPGIGYDEPAVVESGKEA